MPPRRTAAQSICPRTDRGVDRLEPPAYAVVAGKSLGVEQISTGWSDVYLFKKRFLQYGRFTTA